jgi:trimethylamine--corrinoid protein Co-methyltransferase
MHMRTMQVSYGSPVATMTCAMGAEVFKSLKMPTWSLAGATDSKCVDQQAAIESTMQVMANYASGANLIHDVGFVEMGMTGSLEQLVIGDEIISMTRALYRAVEISERTLALDVIDERGPGGDFLTCDHTLDNYRQELWHGSLVNNEGYDEWARRGKPTMLDAAREKARRILATHAPPPLPAEAAAGLDRLVAAAEREHREGL